LFLLPERERTTVSAYVERMQQSPRERIARELDG